MALNAIRTIHDVVDDLASGAYDHVHFGAPQQPFVTFAHERLGGERGLVIETHPARVRAALDLGIDAVQGNYAAKSLAPESVRFVTMNNVLPRLDSLLGVRNTISAAARLARDFLYIQFSNFDDEEILRDCGLKMFYADWSGNTLHLKSGQLEAILDKLEFSDHVFQMAGPTIHSSDPFLHSLASSPDQSKYDADRHPQKPVMELPRPVFKSLVCLVCLRQELSDWDGIVKAKEDAQPLSSPTRTVILHGSDVDTRKQHLHQLRELMLLDRRWAYLRYLHLRRGFLMAGDVESVLGIGVGHAFAELALAVEFPNVTFNLTDINAYAEDAKRLVQDWNLDNVSFGRVNILEPILERYDFVESVEVLEHIEDHTRAAANMQACTRRAVFALVPFADKASNADEALRKQEWENHEHFRVGYDEEDLRAVFRNVIHVQGCYWRDGGAKYRFRVTNLSDEEIRAKTEDLVSLALLDDQRRVPDDRDQAKGIWMLTEGDPGTVHS